MKTKHLGSCHCGAVRFAVELDTDDGATRCNCSICHKTAVTSSVVKPAAFQLLEGEKYISSYPWRAKPNERFFCRNCGVHCYGQGHVEELGGDFISVNVNLLEGVDSNQLKIGYWDGRHDNWMAGLRPQPWPLWA